MQFERIAFVVNNGAFFVSHRLRLAIHAKSLGISVSLFTGQAGSISMEDLSDRILLDLGVPHRRVVFRAAGLNPLIELLGLLQLIWFLRKYRPQIVHCVSPKGVLYGGIAARFCGAKGVVLAISGMGYLFTSSDQYAWLRSVVKKVFKVIAYFSFAHQNLRVIVQNKDDKAAIIESGLASNAQVHLIPGSGVELERFQGFSPFTKDKIILLPARMLRDKGVVEFVKAAKLVKAKESSWRFILAGAADYSNPSAISVEEIACWQREGAIEWIGYVENLEVLLSKSAIVCLPSYREGMPKSLLEAAAAGCAVVATDVPGCREALIDGETGDLVPVGDVEALSQVLLDLIEDNDRRIGYGVKGQKRAQKLFSIETVVNKTFDIYSEVLQSK